MQVQQPKVEIRLTGQDFTLNFNNPDLQARLDRMMTNEARLALRVALGQAEKPLGLLQERTSNDTTTALPMFAAEVVPVSEDPSPHGWHSKLWSLARPHEFGVGEIP